MSRQQSGERDQSFPKDEEQPPAPTEAAAGALRALVGQRAGRRLPGERELAARLEISRPRLRALLAVLQSEGLVQSRQGSGTYALDPTAASARGGNLRRVVLLIDDSLKLGDDPFFSLLLECLQSALQAGGARCVLERTNADDPLPAAQEDGAITLGKTGGALIARQRASDPPMVGLLLGAQTRPNRRASVFQLEDREAGRAAAHRLLETGCRSLVFVGRRDIDASYERLAGAEEAVAAAAAGQAAARLFFVESALNYGAGLTLGREMDLPTTNGPVGIIAANDWLAVGLRAGLQQRRERADPPLVSFDGLPLASAPSLEIASLAIPIEMIAGDAVAELRRLHSGSGGAAGRVLRYPLRWIKSGR